VEENPLWGADPETRKHRRVPHVEEKFLDPLREKRGQRTEHRDEIDDIMMT
jgi:hypothetical protein